MIFLDTSFLGALFILNDAWHRPARAWSTLVKPPLLTTDYILLEFADGFATTLGPVFDVPEKRRRPCPIRRVCRERDFTA